MLAQYCLLGYGLHSKFALQLLTHHCELCTRMVSATHFIIWTTSSLLVKYQLSADCGDTLERDFSTCHFLGVPVAPNKIHRPTSVITFLGIEIDTKTLQLHLLESKVSELLQTLKNGC